MSIEETDMNPYYDINISCLNYWLKLEVIIAK